LGDAHRTGGPPRDRDLEQRKDVRTPCTVTKVHSSDILPGIESAGVIVYKPMDPNAPTKLVMKASSDDYMVHFEPFQFSVAGG